MSLHFNNGRVLLKNTTDGLWYYLGIELNESLEPTLQPEQDGISISGDPYNTYAVLVDTDGNYFKLTLETSDGVVTYGLMVITPPEPTDRILLKDETGVYYRLILFATEEATHPLLVAITNDVTTVQTPFPTLIPAYALGKTTVIVPTI